MLFNSPVYILLFLPLTVGGYLGLQRLGRPVAGKAWLIGASLYFYAYWNPIYLPLILGSMAVNFGVGTALHRSKKGSSGWWSRKHTLLCGIALNLGLLGYFKYTDFFITNVNQVLATDWPLLHLALPLAISFFTFQQIAYLCDSYQADTQEYSILNYSLFVTFFPQLIAGPIVHHREMMPQFSSMRAQTLCGRNMAMGLFVFSMGLFKKVAIADTFAVWARAGFDGGSALSLVEAWGASLSYTLQLYYDFSGYSDMAIGAALFFNIRLPVNFNSPYKATSIQDFWRRWHMTLSRWLRDYIYIPLGGNRKGRQRTYINVFLTMLLGGLWHGAGWTFVLWGAVHGVAIMVNRAWSGAGRRLPAFVGLGITLFFVNGAWVLFRAASMDEVLRMGLGMGGMGGFWPVSNVFGGSTAVVPGWLRGGSEIDWELVSMWGLIGLFTAVALWTPNTLEWVRYVGPGEEEGAPGRYSWQPTMWNVLAAALLMMVSLALVLGLFSAAHVSDFLYFQF